MMRFSFSAAPLLALLLTSCANQGTVVQKNSNPMPFYHSLGIDGSYKLALRDNSGAVHSQLVTPEVYQDYAEGDYFNDTQPPLTPSGKSAEVKDTITLRPAPAQTLASHGVGNGKRLAGNAGGAARHHSMTATRRPATNNHHLVASAQKPASPAPTVPKPAIPVVAAHFAVAVQPATSVQPTEIKSEISPVAQVVAANIQTAPRVVSMKPVAPKLIAQTNAQKIPANRTATAPVSQRSYHVASTASTIPSTAKVASTSTKVTPSSQVAFMTQKVAAQPETSAVATANQVSTSTPKTGASSKSKPKSIKAKQHAKHVAS